MPAMPLSVDRVFEALARFVVRLRWAIVVFWILVAVVTTASLPSLASEVNNNNSAFLPSNAPSRNWWPSSMGRLRPKHSPTLEPAEVPE
jgi:hypothetical protein